MEAGRPHLLRLPFTHPPRHQEKHVRCIELGSESGYLSVSAMLISEADMGAILYSSMASNGIVDI